MQKSAKNRQKKRAKLQPKSPICPLCKRPLLFVDDFQLHHCFHCGGWFVAERMRQNV